MFLDLLISFFNVNNKFIDFIDSVELVKFKTSISKHSSYNFNFDKIPYYYLKLNNFKKLMAEFNEKRITKFELMYVLNYIVLISDFWDFEDNLLEEIERQLLILELS